MAELQFQAEVEPQLLNGDDLNEEREEADASESVKKKRRKKKRSRTTAPGKERILRLEDPFKENSAKNIYIFPLLLGVVQSIKCTGHETFSTCQRVFLSRCPNSQRLLLKLRALIWKRDRLRKWNVTSKMDWKLSLEDMRGINVTFPD